MGSGKLPLTLNLLCEGGQVARGCFEVGLVGGELVLEGAEEGIHF